MDVILWGIAVFLMFLLVILILYYKKQISSKDARIRELLESYTSLQSQIEIEERRKAFRVMLENQECSFELVNSSDPAFAMLKNKKGKGKIKDISFTGLKLSCQLDLPVKKRIVVQLDFKFYDEEFSIKGLVIRKEETFREWVYGIQFSEIEGTKEQYRLIPILNRIELERRKGFRNLEDKNLKKNPYN